ncbi:alpha-L-rhamnosidase [Pseudoduganella namucuonensis]|nr:alpha-L-rhamnosidase [Pseudoduganella namucuonensis]
MAAAPRVGDLRVEYTTTPIGIDIERPRFSWKMLADGQAKGQRQTAYALVVKDGGEVVWKSGKIKNDQSLNIEYAGKPLAAARRYDWSVEVWDGNDRPRQAASWFETGLSQSDAKLASWSGAKWIGGGDRDLPLYSPYLPVFKINYAMRLDQASGSTRAGFVYGANDPRLMDKVKNLHHLESAKNASFVMLEIDIAPLLSKSNAVLNIYRVGYTPKDSKDVPFKSLAIPLSVINENNKYEAHKVSLSSSLGNTRLEINGDGKENLIADLNLNPLGGDAIAFPVVADIGFHAPRGQSAAFSNVEVRNYRSPSNPLFSELLAGKPYAGIFSGSNGGVIVSNNAYRIEGGQEGRTVVADPSRNAMPMLRTSFSASRAAIARARLYVTARGIYEVHLNGKKVGNDYFNPGLTQYNRTHLYQTYDVTSLVKPGRNALGAMLGEGWWSGGATYMGQFWNFFGDRQSLLAKLVITYADGKEDVVVSDPASWQYFNDGPLRYGSLFQGEVYDASKEKLVRGWSTASYDASAWQPAVEVGLSGNISKDPSNRSHGMPPVDDYSQWRLSGQFDQPVRNVRQLQAQSVKEVRPGVFVYDMGQNMVGVPEVMLSGVAPGKKVVLRFAEVSYPDMPQYAGNQGMIMLENIRGAMAQEIYVTRGGAEVIAPRFTSHGFRYIEITGLAKALPLKSVTGRVLSSVHKLASHYETSNAKVNKLWENITWSTYGNFLSIPTDCPQRNERLGWSGDISVFSRTATYMAELPQFLRRHMLAMRDTQRDDGRFTDVAPLGGGFGGVLWGSAAITVAWESYQQYADKALAAEHYDAMKRYIDFVVAKNFDRQSGVLVQEDPTAWGNLGDWLGPEQEKNDNSLLWEAQFINDLQIMSRFAAVLGKAADAEAFDRLIAERKRFFSAHYIDPQSGKTVRSSFNQFPATKRSAGDPIDTQTSYVLPLAFDLLGDKEREAAGRHLATTVQRANHAGNGTALPPYSLMTGFIGTAWINQALSDSGRSDLAYRLLQQTSYPSWLYPVEQGATTVWERLDSYTATNGFGGNNTMNSFNHYSFGAVGAWMVDHSLGIARDEASPGFKHFILKPEADPTGGMRHAKGHYDGMYGRIESGWKRAGDKTEYTFAIPANSSATVLIPASHAGAVLIDGKAGDTPHVKFVKHEGGKAVFEVASGRYTFTAR